MSCVRSGDSDQRSIKDKLPPLLGPRGGVLSTLSRGEHSSPLPGANGRAPVRLQRDRLLLDLPDRGENPLSGAITVPSEVALLHLAAWGGSADVARLFLAAGAAPPPCTCIRSLVNSTSFPEEAAGSLLGRRGLGRRFLAIERPAAR